MKYIRTKDGIYEVIELHTITNEKGSFISDYFCKGFRIVLAENVIDIANTIEDLCDEFVVYVKDNIKAIRMFPKGKAMEYSTYLKQTDNLDSEIYGAIFTGKGLIYVAKMNDKGELELL